MKIFLKSDDFDYDQQLIHIMSLVLDLCFSTIYFSLVYVKRIVVFNIVGESTRNMINKREKSQQCYLRTKILRGL